MSNTRESPTAMEAAKSMQFFLIQSARMVAAFEAARQEVGNPAQLWLNMRTLLQRLKFFAGQIQADTVCDGMWPEHWGSYEGVRRLTTQELIHAIEVGELNAIELAYWRWHAVMTEHLVIDAFYKAGAQQTGAAKADRLRRHTVTAKLRYQGGKLEHSDREATFPLNREFILAFKYRQEADGSGHQWQKHLSELGVTRYTAKKLAPDAFEKKAPQ